MTNRDSQSEFLTEIQNSKVEPIEPVFVDYKKDMSQFEAQKGVNVLYKKNETNDIFTLIYVSTRVRRTTRHSTSPSTT